MPRVISDAEMDRMVAQKPAKRIITDEEMNKIDPNPRRALTPVESGISGLAQGLTFGFSDEIIGAAGAALGSLAGKGKYSELYPQIRDQYRARQDMAQADNPGSYTLGNVGGSLGSLAIPGVAPAKGASILANMGRAAAAGGLAGAGLSEADPTQSYEKLKEFGGDVALGGTIGALTQGAIDKAAKAVGKISPSNLRKFAEEKAVKAAGAMTKDFKKLQKAGLVHKTGRELLDKKIVKAFTTLDDIGEAAEQLKSNAGERIGKALSDVDDLVVKAESMIDEGKLFGFLPDKEVAKKYLKENFQFNMQNVANRIQSELIDANASNPLLKNELSKLAGVADDFRGLGPQTLKNANVIKTTAGKLAKFDSVTDTLPSAFKKQMYGIIKDELDNTVGKIGNLEDGLAKAGVNMEKVIADNLTSVKDINVRNQIAKSSYEEAKKTYQLGSNLEDIATSRKAQEMSNRSISLTDTIGAGAGYVTNGVTGGVVLGLLNKMGRKYGASLQAVGADKLADILSKAPNALGKFGARLEKAATQGPNALIATHMILMKDPNYKRIIEQQEKQKASGLKLPEPQGLTIPGR